MLTIDEVCDVIDGHLPDKQGSTRIKGVSIDTRTLRPGEIFIAVKGKNFDGHNFAEAAIRNKACALVVSRRVAMSAGVPVIRVKDTVKALGSLAHAHRMRFKIPVIAITGSVGKTTAKDAITAVLKRKHSVLSNKKSENNHIGLPLTLLRLNKRHQMAVLELGTNQAGDIEYLCAIARPTAGVFLNIGYSHLEGLKTLKGIFREKGRLLNYLSEKGVVIYNQDDAYLRKIRDNHIKRELIAFGIERKCKFQAKSIVLDEARNIKFRVNGRNFQVKTPAKHNIYNVLAAIAIGRYFKIPLNDIEQALRKLNFSYGRMKVQKIKGVQLIDDTYNANPTSLRGAISTLNNLKVKGKRILVCADMLELGDKKKELHARMGREIRATKIDCVFTYGRLTRYLSDAIGSAGINRMVRHFSSLDRLNLTLAKTVKRGDVILVKGSRAFKMERVVNHIKQSKDFIDRNLT